VERGGEEGEDPLDDVIWHAVKVARIVEVGRGRFRGVTMATWRGKGGGGLKRDKIKGLAQGEGGRGREGEGNNEGTGELRSSS